MSTQVARQQLPLSTQEIHEARANADKPTGGHTNSSTQVPTSISPATEYQHASLSQVSNKQNTAVPAGTPIAHSRQIKALQGSSQRSVTQHGQASGPARPVSLAPQYHAQHQVVYYPPQAGIPALMSQCPQCGLVAGQPYVPYQPSPMIAPQQHVQVAQAAGRYHNPTLAHQQPPMIPPYDGNRPQNRGLPGQKTLQLSPPVADRPNARLYVSPHGHKSSAVTPARAASNLPARAAGPQSLSPFFPPQADDNVAHPQEQPAPEPTSRIACPRSSDGAKRIRSRVNNKTDRPYKKRLCRDERRDILLMRRLGYKMDQIAKHLGTTISAVNYTITQGTPDVKHGNAGRKSKFPPDKVDAMVAFVEKYIAKERAAGVDKKTGKKKIVPLTYAMIRDAIFKDESGEILEPLKKVTDDAMKTQLNKHGLWLRNPMSQRQVETARARGKQQWLAKQQKNKTESGKQPSAGYTVSQGVEEEQERDDDRMIGQYHAEVEHDDDDMPDTYSVTDSLSDDDQGGDGLAEVFEDTHIEVQL